MGRIKRQNDFDWWERMLPSGGRLLSNPEIPNLYDWRLPRQPFLGRFDEALPLSRRAVDLDPLNAESWESLGETEFFMGQLDKAEVDFKKALELSADIWASHNLLSQIYITQGRPSGCFARNRASAVSSRTCISVCDCILQAWSGKGVACRVE